MRHFNVIALDLDGTLLDDEKRILPESLLVLEQAQQQGVQVIVVTGRHHTAIHPFYQALNLTSPIICCNGAYLYDYHNQQIIKGSPLSLTQVEHFFDLAAQYQMDGLVVYTDQAIVYETLNMNINRTQIWVDRLPAHLQPNLVQVDNLLLASQQADSVWKIITTHSDAERLRRFGALLEAQLAISCEWLSENTLEIVQQGNIKGNCLKEWVEAQGINLSEVMAFGDNYNDLSMLNVVGLSVAMANSDDAIKKQADLVTLSNNQPGIAEIIKQHVLMNQ